MCDNEDITLNCDTIRQNCAKMIRGFELLLVVYFESIKQLTKVSCFISEINNKCYQCDTKKNKRK